jgi:hypothetical protein
VVGPKRDTAIGYFSQLVRMSPIGIGVDQKDTSTRFNLCVFLVLAEKADILKDCSISFPALDLSVASVPHLFFSFLFPLMAQ